MRIEHALELSKNYDFYIPLSTTKKSICLLGFFFGKKPQFFNLFVESCRYNWSVEFILFTDFIYPDTAPNVNIITFSLDDFNKLASKNLGIDVKVNNPIKVCEFRPAFGVIFHDYIEKFDFWGTIDNDLVFGDIRRFITDSLLTENDIITSREEYLVSHFTMYRNTERINKLFLSSSDYRKIFTDNVYYNFEECNFLWWYLIAGYSIFDKGLQEIRKYFDRNIESITHVVHEAMRERKLKCYFETLMEEQDELDEAGKMRPWVEELQWHEGTLTRLSDGNELMYFHIHFLKNSPDFYIPNWISLPRTFKINSKGFAEISGLPPKDQHR